MKNKDLIKELEKHPNKRVMIQVSEYVFKPVNYVCKETIISYPGCEDIKAIVIGFTPNN